MDVEEMESKWDKILMVQKLKESDKGLYDYVVKNCIEGSNYCDEINNFFDKYTDHSSAHSLAVLKNGSKLADSISLNKIEIAIFILACYFHDIGMNVNDDEIEKYRQDDNFTLEREYLIDSIAAHDELRSDNKELLDKFIMLEYIRNRHHILSSQWINTNYNEDISAFVDIDNSPQNIWKLVSRICEAHCMELNQITDEYYGTESIARYDIDLMFLACLLRLSDYCHIGRDRALPFVRMSKNFYSEKSKRIWIKLGEVNGVRFDKENNRIIVSASCEDSDIHNSLVKESLSIDSELHNHIASAGFVIEKLVEEPKISPYEHIPGMYTLIATKDRIGK